MKYIVCLSLFLIIFSCKKEDSFTINGKIENLSDPKKVYWLKLNESNNEYKRIDSVDIKDNKFEFTGIQTEPDFAFFEIDDLGSFELILEPGTIDVSISQKADGSLNSEIKGTSSNNKLSEIKLQLNPIEEENAKNSRLLNDGSLSEEDRIIVEEKLTKNSTQTIEILRNFIKTNPNEFLSLHFLKLFLQSGTEPIDQIEVYFNPIKEELKNSKIGKEISAKINGSRAVSIGKKAPDFKAKNPEEKEISLYNSLGKKVTIIDFWASWCGPCREENPNVVKVYSKYKDKGLVIISVSLDDDKTKWIEAIKKDQLTWIHISNLKSFEDQIAEQYQIQSIPSTLILDEKGIIVAKDLRGEELENKIAELIQ